MRFRAKVLTSSLQVSYLDLEAENELEARHFAALAGATVVGISGVRASLFDRVKRPSFNLVVFNQQLYTLLEAGQPVLEAVEVLARSDRSGRFGYVFGSLLQSLRQGFQLSDAMQSVPSVFPPLFVSIIRSSETTGTLKEAIQRYLQHQRQAEFIRTKLLSAAIYPAILMAVGCAVIAFLMLYVVPKFSLIFDDIQTAKNAGGGFVHWWGSFVRGYPWLAWPAVLAFFSAPVAVVVNRTIRAYAIKKLLENQWVGYRVWVIQIGRLYRTVAMLLQSGISVVNALRLAFDTLPQSMQNDLLLVIKGVEEGKPLSTLLPESRLGTEVAQRLLHAGESSGALGRMMEKIADFYDQESAAWIDAIGRLIEPLLMIVIGIVIGLIVLMLYSPIFDLANAV